MRIISGKNKGIRLQCPSGKEVRPTSDKVREALFQIIDSKYIASWSETTVLDLFAGSGALGLEALSRGALKSVFVESASRHIKFIKDNIMACGADDNCILYKAFVPMSKKFTEKIFEHGPYHLIFADPPYSQNLSEKAASQIVRKGLLAIGGLLVIEEFQKISLPETFQGLESTLYLNEKRRYGQTCLWFYTLKMEDKDV